MLRLPAVEGPKKPPASDCDLPKNGEVTIPFGAPRFSWLKMFWPKTANVRLYLREVRGVQRTTPALIAAQSSAAKSAATRRRRVGHRRPLATAAGDPRAKSNHLADAQVQADICRPGAEIVRNDLFACASWAGERIRIEAAVGRRDDVRLTATRAKVGRALNWLLPVRSVPV